MVFHRLPKFGPKKVFCLIWFLVISRVELFAEVHPVYGPFSQLHEHSFVRLRINIPN